MPSPHMSSFASSSTRNNDIVRDPNISWLQIKDSQSFMQVQTEVNQPYDPTKYTRIACMTDTHGRHRHFEVPLCDILVHCGDFSKLPTIEAIEDLNSYFGSVLKEQQSLHEQWQEQHQEGQTDRPSRGKIPILCIAGNHDMLFDKTKSSHIVDEAKRKMKNCIYLEDESFTYKTLYSEVEIWGSPWQPHHNTPFNAFKLPRDLLYTKWDKIPSTTDVLLTHSPPLGRGDLSRRGIRAGCLTLLQQVQSRIQPRLHVSGHLHEATGASHDGHTTFVNACQHLNRDNHTKTCILIDVPHDKSLPVTVVNDVLDQFA